MITNPSFGVIGDGCFQFFGAFAPNGAGAIDASLHRSSRGGGARPGFTVVRTSTGLWTVTFEDPITELVQCRPSLAACPAGATVQAGQGPGAVLVNQSQFTLLTYDATGALLDVPAAAGRRIQFELCLRRTRVF